MAKNPLVEAIDRLGYAKEKHEKELGQKHDPTVTPAGPYGHGNGGLFSRSGQQPDVFSAMQLPESAFFDSLPVLPDRMTGRFGAFQLPVNTVLTGVTAGDLDDVDNQPTEPCEPGPRGGFKKVCRFTMPLGKYRGSFDLNLEAIDELRDIGEPQNLQLVNNPAQAVTGLLGPSVAALGDILYDEMADRAFESVVSYKRMLAERIWIGNPTNSAASNNWKDIVGMEIIVNQNNKYDIDTNAICKAANSDIKNFNFGFVSTSFALLFAYIDAMVMYLDWNARHQKLTPWTFDIVMRPELYDELTKVWPVARYVEALAAMQAYSAANVNIIAEDVIKMKDDMRQASVLAIRGRLIRVLQDDTLPELTPNDNANLHPGEYASDIWFVPRTVLGGIQATYINPKVQNNQIVENTIAKGRLLGTFTSDGGLFRWYIRQDGPCVQWDYMASWRIMMLTTQLAGRITNVAYRPTQHVRSWKPNTDYNFNGGRTTGDTEQYYSPWTTVTDIGRN